LRTAIITTGGNVALSNHARRLLLHRYGKPFAQDDTTLLYHCLPSGPYAFHRRNRFLNEVANAGYHALTFKLAKPHRERVRHYTHSETIWKLLDDRYYMSTAGGWELSDPPVGEILATKNVVKAGRVYYPWSDGSRRSYQEIPYTTNFPLTENPISEGGKWRNGGIDAPRTNVQTDGAGAFGTMSTFDGTNFPDSVAFLNGYTNDHSISTVLRNNAAPTTMEVEQILRGDITSTSQPGYEVDLGQSFGLNLVRLNGPDNDFTIAPGFPITGGSISTSDGAIWFSKIQGNLINVKCNGSFVVTNFDITTGFGGGLVITSGNPGQGYWNDTNSSANSPKFAWKSWTSDNV
jgi:hypothetical protein